MVSSVEIHLSMFEPKNGAISTAPIQHKLHQEQLLLAARGDGGDARDATSNVTVTVTA